MASSSQQDAASRQPAAPPAQGVERLPNDVLVRILGALSVTERQRAALVCRRWHICAHAPELCRELDVEIGLDQGPPPRSLPSFCEWLARHGQHLRRLDLALWNYASLMEAERQLAQHMPQAAAAMSQLERLFLTLRNPSRVTWARQLPASLRELGLFMGRAGYQLKIASSLSGLTQLTKLVLAAELLTVDRRVKLPRSIRTLAHRGYSDDGLPPQLSTLRRLDTLVATGCKLDGLDVCTAMKKLTALYLTHTHWMECIGELTGLQHLVLHDVRPVDVSGDEMLEQMGAALRRMTGLTAVLLAHPSDWALDLAAGTQDRVIPALAGLSRLQRLCYHSTAGIPQLPPGPYSASLRMLAASVDCLNRSTALLASCSALEHVTLFQGSYAGPLWQWAAQHPPLRRLQVCDDLLTFSYKLELLEMASLRQARPQLWVDCTAERPFLALFKWREPVWNAMLD